MYPQLSLYKEYLKKNHNDEFSSYFKDVTRKITLNNINYAINNCEDWGTFIDIGGYDGRYSSPLANCFDKGILIEVETLNGHKKLEMEQPNIKVLNCLIENYRTSEKCNFILLADVFEHIVDIHSFAKKISSLQSTGGVTYILTPNPTFCGPVTKSNLYYKLKSYGHIKHYNKFEIEDIMSKVNYRLLYSTYEETPLRQKIKKYIFAISRRDKNFSKYLIYKIFQPILILLSIPLLKVVEIVVYKSELKATNFNAMSQCLVFKKM